MATCIHNLGKVTRCDARAEDTFDLYCLDHTPYVHGPCGAYIAKRGKFEGELGYINHLYEWSMDGGASDTVYFDDSGCIEFFTGPFDCPAMTAYGYVLDFTSEQGFVYAIAYDTEAEYQSALDAANTRAEIANGPQKGDIVLSDSGPLGALTRATQYGDIIAESVDYDVVINAVRDHMDTAKFWPNVWRMSDHGNATLLSPLD